LFDGPADNLDPEDVFEMEDDLALPDSVLSPPRGSTPSKQVSAASTDGPRGTPWRSSGVEATKKWVGLRILSSCAR
jgi:hypothetical protein